MFKRLNKIFSGSDAGFSLVELLTALTIFSFIILIVVATYIQSLQIRQRSFYAEAIQRNALPVLELMAKEIRVSQIQDQNNNCSTDPALNQLTIAHPDEGTILYRLDAQSRVERVVGGVTYYLSYDEVIFNSLRFCVAGSALPSDDQSARVAIIASISNRSGKEILTINLQTAVTSRNINNELQ